MRNLFLIFSLLLLFVSAEAKVIKKNKAPDFYLYDVNNKIVHLYSEKFNNSIIVINFFAEWCIPCIEEIPYLESLYEKYKNNNVIFFGVLINSKISKDKLIKFIKENNITYPVLKGNKEVVKKYNGIYVIPTTFILNQKKVISKRIIGKINYKKLDSEISKLIKIRKSM